MPIPQFATAALIDIMRDDGTVRRISVAHDAEERELRLRKIAEDFVIDPASPQMAVFQTGTPQLGQLDDDEAPLYATSDAEQQLLKDLHCRAFLALPLSTRGKVFGCITLLSTGRHNYGVTEFTTASEYARRASLAFDHALLYRDAVRARAAAEEAEAQFRALVNGFRESEDRLRTVSEERRESEIRLRESEHFTRTIISSVQQGVIVYDRDLRYCVFNRFMEEITGVKAEDVLGRIPGDVFPHLVENGIDRLLVRALAGETVRANDTPYVIPHTGRQGWTSAVYSPHKSPEGEIIGVVAIIVDITERKLAEDQLTHNAFHDALTGLPNRSLFVDRLERLMRHTERTPTYMFAVAFLDLDRFKVVNDSLGHLVGDELLIALGQRLAGCLRQGDTVARLGGDEFALLLDNVTDAADATRVAERVLEDIVHPFMLTSGEVFTNVSIGIALSSPGYQRPEDILRDADTAMYRAKLEGRSRYEVFDRNMHETAVHVHEFETDLRRALDRSEFMLYYQPIIVLGTGRITGFEALIRWKHPKRGIVAPDDFIPLAEETGLIVPIGWWVLEEACRQLSLWNARFTPPEPFTVSVNLSAKQFLQNDLLAQLDRVLERTAMNPKWLQLEITESVVIRNEESVAATLEALRDRGIHLCLDDFGTGYSSLSYLHAFPIDTLKIDRSFVGQIDQEAGAPGLVETIVALSRNLGMDAVAEGVETREQLAFLRKVGPEFAQGYFFSAALAPDQIEEMLSRNPVW